MQLFNARIATRRGLAVAAVVAMACIARAAPPTLDERFLDGLRQRELFELAERFCRERLEKGSLSDNERADLTIELSRCLAEQALQSRVDTRDERWQQAITVLAQFLKTSAESAHAVQVATQQALVQLTWGETLRQEAELTGRRESTIAAAQEHVRAAIDELRQVAERCAEMLRRRQLGRAAEVGELSTDEIQSLARNIQYQLARALRNQGQSYPRDSADSVNSLSQASETLRPLAQLDTADALAWPARIDAVECFRLLGHADAATRRLDLIDSQAPPSNVALRARGERIRLAIDQGDVAAAMALVEKPLDGAEPTAEWDYTVLEARLAAWRAAIAAQKPELAKTWEAQATSVLRDIRQRHSAYWARRAELLFAERIAADARGADSAALVRAAEGFYRAGQFDEAITAYDQAAEKARQSKALTQAFDLEFIAAAIAQQRGNFAQASERFRKAAVAARDHARANEAHWMAIHNLASETRDADSQQNERLATLLDEHLATWPRSATADRARLWLARAEERSGRFASAIERYASICSASEAREAIDGLSRCYRAQLAELHAAKKPTHALANKAAEAIVRRRDEAATDRDAPSRLRAPCAIASARILLDYADNPFAVVEKQLNDVLADANQDVREEWQATARALLIYALAAQGRIEDARKHVDLLANASRDDVRLLAESLDRRLDVAQDKPRGDIAALAIHVLDLIEKKSNTADDDARRLAALWRGRALAAAGRTDEAVRLLRTLAADRPRDGQVQEALAQVLFEARDPQAADLWRNVERKSRPGGDRWLRAKLYQALILEQSGDRRAAAAIVKVVMAQYPELGGAALKEKYLALLRRCQ